MLGGSMGFDGMVDWICCDWFLVRVRVGIGCGEDAGVLGMGF